MKPRDTKERQQLSADARLTVLFLAVALRLRPKQPHQSEVYFAARRFTVPSGDAKVTESNGLS